MPDRSSEKSREKTAVLLLAAGASQRLGQPKQLLQAGGASLLLSMARLGLAIGPVVVVVGAGADAMQAELSGLPVQLVHNPDWRQGLSTSIRAGMQALQATDYDGVLMLLTDQPHVSAALLDQLVATWKTGRHGMVACRYAGQPGVPALFSRTYETALMQLTGDTGAKKLLLQHPADCGQVLFEAAATDLDTPADVARWQAESPR